MNRTLATVVRAGAVLGMWVGLVVAAVDPQPAAAQMWAAVAISPSTLITGECHSDPSQANTELSAVHYCSIGGHQDCKVVAVVANACVALARPAKLVVNQYGYSVGQTREAAATQALAECVKAGGADCVVVESPCANDDPRWAPPLPLPPPPSGSKLTVDPGLVGSWKMSLVGGIWVWQIAANGTYTFNSEAGDNTPTHNGSFTASSGKYMLHAYNITWDDQGTYTIQAGGNSVVMTGKLGTGTWIRMTNNPILNAVGNGIRK